MVSGIGIDIIEIDRISGSITKFGDHFVDRIYTDLEKDYCYSKGNSGQHFAARFAAKEAVSKALAVVWQPKYGWKNIEIFNTQNGEPKVRLKGGLEEALVNGMDLKISISHSHNYVTCVAIYFKTIAV